mmetsp:Transcript_1519/g.5999  ORF Transcript_1519/g.5999 Transcript_1519/m.5999 type:complete len:822 (-) Transcript_1519:95-2560(-)
MAAGRACPWVHSMPPSAERALDSVLSSEDKGATAAKLLLVGRRGATSFTLVELRPSAAGQERVKTVVSLGHRLTCSLCSGDRAAEACCKHSMFVLHRVLGLASTDPLLWQLSFTDAEIERLLASASARGQGPGRSAPAESGATGSSGDMPPHARSLGKGSVASGRRALEPGESCPICMDTMSPEDALVGCEQCYNLVHNRCMRVWAEHKQASGDAVSCPLCRANWGTKADPSRLRRDAAEHLKRHPPAVHRGVRCGSCGRGPIVGRRFRCLQCPEAASGPARHRAASHSRGLDLCSECFFAGAHPEHVFLCRATATQLPTSFRAYLDTPFAPADVASGGKKASRRQRRSLASRHGSLPAGRTDDLTTWSGWEVAERRGPALAGLRSASAFLRARRPAHSASATSASSASAAAMLELQSRELTPSDYELLLSLDGGALTLVQHLCSGFDCCAGDEPLPCAMCSTLIPVLDEGTASALVRHCGRAGGAAAPGASAPAPPSRVGRVLPCGHCVHEECLRGQLASRDLACPACQAAAPPDPSPGIVDEARHVASRRSESVPWRALLFPGLLHRPKPARSEPRVPATAAGFCKDAPAAPPSVAGHPLHLAGQGHRTPSATGQRGRGRAGVRPDKSSARGRLIGRSMPKRKGTEPTGELPQLVGRCLSGLAMLPASGRPETNRLQSPFGSGQGQPCSSARLLRERAEEPLARASTDRRLASGAPPRQAANGTRATSRTLASAAAQPPAIATRMSTMQVVGSAKTPPLRSPREATGGAGWPLELPSRRAPRAGRTIRSIHTPSVALSDGGGGLPELNLAVGGSALRRA